MEKLWNSKKRDYLKENIYKNFSIFDNSYFRIDDYWFKCSKNISILRIIRQLLKINHLSKFN